MRRKCFEEHDKLQKSESGKLLAPWHQAISIYFRAVLLLLGAEALASDLVHAGKICGLFCFENSQEERSEYGLKDFESDAAAVKDSSSFSWEENRYDHIYIAWR